ncbi:MAG: VIT1/CCC1 transporter family protein, partial [Acidaminococcaceae bacterium]
MNDIKRYKNNLSEERNSAALYKAMAEQEKNPTIKAIYFRLAATEEKHASKWESLLLEKGVNIPSYHLSFRTKSLIWLMQKFGADFILPSMVSSEGVAASDYSTQPEANSMVSSERAHAILLGQLNNSEITAGLDGPTLAKMEGRHRSAGGNTLRAAVLGASDGLVSNFNLVMGVAGAAVSSSNILLTGIAVLLAGGISMALGEWISVQSS